MEKIETQLKQPPKVVVKKRSKWFTYLLLGLIIGFSVLAFFAKNYPYFPFDLVITREIQLITLPLFREAMLGMTWLGYTLQGTYLLLVGCIALLAWKKNTDALILFLSTTGAVALSILAKTIVARPRPDPNLIHQLATYTAHDSFPSGHVLFFVGFMGYLLYLVTIYTQKGIVRTVLVTITGLLIILMGVSRIYLGAHWFSDTLGAYLIGTSWLFLVVWLRHRFIDFPSKNS